MAETGEAKPNDPKAPDLAGADAPADMAAAGSASDTAPEADSAPESAPGGAALELDELSADAEAPAEAEIDPKDARIAELEAETAAVRDQLLRAAADVQNTRKRADKERKEAETYGGIRLARELLSVYDNLEAALKAASDELQEREPEFFNGVSLTLRNLLQSFEKHQITKVSPEKGEKFDPNRHQAMFEAPTNEVAPGSVLEVLQVGFVIGDRLLRPAMVSVARAGATQASG